MPKFGPNGSVLDVSARAGENHRDYESTEKPKIRRVLLATLLCAIAASISVALIAAILAFTYSSIISVLGLPPARFEQQQGFMTGAVLAVMMAAFNWYLFYIVVPITWVALLLSIGRFPRRGIVRHVPYYRWGAIWGGLLVGGTTGFFGLAMENGSFAGALVTGLLIGGLAGALCASLFLAIVRPQQQVSTIQTDVF